MMQTAFKRIIQVSALVLAVGGSSPAEAATYNIDPEHSKVQFKVRHLGISNVTGHFNSFSGKFHFDPKNIAASTVEAEIEVKSIDTENEKRDTHLRSDEFLNEQKHPKITFKSKQIRDIDDDEFEVVGDLTINGVTREIVLDVEHIGIVKDPWGNERAGFEAEVDLNRKDYGVTWNKILETGGLLVGENVDVTLEIEGIREKQ